VAIVGADRDAKDDIVTTARHADLGVVFCRRLTKPVKPGPRVGLRANLDVYNVCDDSSISSGNVAYNSQ
jgi:hypothetical protein